MRRVLVVLVLAVSGCGGGDSEPLSQTAQSGETLFAERVLGGNPGCVTCHSVEPGRVLIGPSMADVAARAGDRIEGVGASEYLRSSIVTPDSFVVDGFEPGRMPQDWAEVLSVAEIDALVTYLLELES